MLSTTSDYFFTQWQLARTILYIMLIEMGGTFSRRILQHI